MHLPRWLAQRNIFYGWIVVGVCFVVIALTFGVRLSFGIFFDALIREGPDGQAFNWTRADTAGIFSISMVVFAGTGTLFGWLLDRLGARRVFVLGLLLMISGLLLTSRMTSLWQFALYYGLWTSLGVTALGLTIQAATLSRWFSRHGQRGLAIGLAFSGTGAGILVLAPVVERVISRYGWRSAYVLLAALLLLVALPVTLLFLRDDPAQLGLHPDGAPSTTADSYRSPASSRRPPISSLQSPSWTFRAAAGSVSFWLLMLSGTYSLFTLRMVSVHQVAYLVDRGVPRLTAATVIGAAGLITALAFIGFGGLSDRMGRAHAFHLGAIAQIVALLVLMGLPPAAPTPILYLYALFWGIGEGGRSGLLSAIVSDSFPGPAQGTIVGTLGAFFGVGAAAGSWLGGAVYDWTGEYMLAFQIALLATLAATAAVALTTNNGRRMTDDE